MSTGLLDEALPQAARRAAPMLAVTGLNKSYGETHCLHDVSIAVPEGEFFTLLGPSGCGKTTLLRCVAGLITPESGEIRIDGEPVYARAGSRVTDVNTERRPIGMVFQSYAIWPHMTVFANAAYALRYGRQRTARRDIPRLVGDMLAKVGLESYADRPATDLSGGQQQRLALARALLGKPKLLLLDEPLSNLDAKLRTSLRAELKTLQREAGVTTLYVTHDQSEALAMSDSVAVMQNGVVAQMGTPREVYETPASEFVARFVGDSNLIPGVVRGGGFDIECAMGLVRASRGGASEGDSVLVSVHPEDVSVAPLDDKATVETRNRGRVTHAEFLGETVALTVDVHGVELRCKADKSLRVFRGDDVLVQLPPDKIHVIPRD